MKLGKIIVLSIILVSMVSIAWARNHNGNGQHGNGYHKNYQNCNGQYGNGFIDKDKDGICDNYVDGKKGSGRKFRQCSAAKGRMMKMSNCPGWQAGDNVDAATEQNSITDNTAETE